MSKIQLGIIREGKLPFDKRVALTPFQCQTLIHAFPQVELFIQPSAHRCISETEYENVGVKIQEDLKNCDILIGIKEVPIDQLIPNKTYLFFSHTIKKQTHNRNLLRAILKNNIRLIDFETLTWPNGSRILGFGRFAGIVGTHNGFLTYGRKYKLYDLKPAHECQHFDELISYYKKITLPPIKICLTGDGRVSHGSLEFLNKIGIREVTPRAFLQETFDEPVYVHLRSEHYYEHKDHRPWDKSDFYHNPEDYISTFKEYSHVCDMMINGILWKPGIPAFFTKEEIKSVEFKIQVIADISCDIPGSLPTTIRSTTIEDPVYGFHKLTQLECPAYLTNTIDVMAVGNLPCELPFDASKGFGEDMMRSVIPLLLSGNESDILENATIAKDGKLTSKFSYLEDYIS